MVLRLYNSLTRKKEEFVPLDPANVRLYVCGPTVYDQAHIGNARPVIVFDVLYRLLRHLYGKTHVTYARNITDVDDKIIDRARRDFPDLDLNTAIKQVTTSTTAQFHADVKALGCLEPTIEPKATDHIEEMKAIIATLVDKGFAYEAGGHVLFRVDRMADYGQLSGRTTDEMIAGARVEVAPYKENPMDFVLWKPSGADQPGWDSPWGRGRPGWHLECSAMAEKHLGQVFDIHGGGVDLKFPHHENEIAQSRCAHGTGVMANYWMHNGFLQVEGEKMSKSAGNFVTIRELLETGHFGGRAWPGEVLRLAMLKSHYRRPIDWTVRAASEAIHTLDNWQRRADHSLVNHENENIDQGVIDALLDDLNTPQAITRLHAMYDEIQSRKSGSEQIEQKKRFRASARFMGLLSNSPEQWFGEQSRQDDLHINDKPLTGYIDARNAARKAKDFAEADRIRDELAAEGVILKDNPDGTTEWEIAR